MKLSSITKKNTLATLKYGLAMLIANIYRKYGNKVWIVSERENQARDNGFVLFKFMRENYPNKPVFYLIDKKSSDYKKVAKYGNVIQFNSWKHYLYYCLAKIHISAHVNGCCPDGAIGISRRTKHILKFKDVFLPHGVSYGISEFCLKKYAKIDLFICSGEPEYRNVLENYGYSKYEVTYTGFPRLDMWHDIEVNQKQIVLMPTWRLYLAQDNNTVFQDTTYFKTYQSLIRDVKLSKFLQDNNLKMIFYLHNEMKKYVNFFQTECSNIEIVYKDDLYDIQEILKTSALLITDYSSVHFDFAYMKKPVIYYQFDKDEFFVHQYQKSSFDAEKDGFAPVVYDEENLVTEIEYSYENKFQVEQKYYGRMRKFYEIYDEHNCERVYSAIKKLDYH